LYFHHKDLMGSRRIHNLSPKFLTRLARVLNLSQDAAAHNLPVGLTPERIFGYVYAVLNSSIYRSRYGEFLKIEFPLAPLPSSKIFFNELAELGAKLVALHLLDGSVATSLGDPKQLRFAGRGSGSVEKSFPKWDNGRVMINAGRWFEEVPKATWSFHIG